MYLECAGISQCQNWWAQTKVTPSQAILPAEAAQPFQTLVLGSLNHTMSITGPGPGLAFLLVFVFFALSSNNPPAEERDGFGSKISSFRYHCYSFLGSVSAAACPTHVSSLAFNVSKDLKTVLFQVSLVELASTSLSPLDSWMILD